MQPMPQASSTTDTKIASALLDWFSRHKRDLPWRRTYAPYHVWISEIMLQQTQMERGVEYFKRWIERFPDVHSLADAGEDEVLKLWEGLGYYSRARNLHKAARMVRDRHHGQLPATAEELQALPGIGDWTAQYIAMRALRWPDAFPAGDVALHKALGLSASKRPAQDAVAASQAWQPWRSYAVVRAWSSMSPSAQKNQKP